MNTEKMNPELKLATFDFDETPVRVLERDGEPWFVAADVCRVLDLGNTTEALRPLDEADLSNTEVRSESANGVEQSRAMNIINESGLYQLVFASRKPEAKAFKRWVTKEVLPAIRKTGRYALPAAVTRSEECEIDAVLGELRALLGCVICGAVPPAVASAASAVAKQYIQAWDVKLRLQSGGGLWRTLSGSGCMRGGRW
jgi:prophage antirepressor-like protein